MSVKLIDTKNLSVPVVKSHDKHHEFVQGVDWSPLSQNLITSISWDQKMYVWDVASEQPFIQ
jgi:WD40 repeat protein